MEICVFPEEGSFLIAPFREISKIVIEKESNENIIIEIFKILFDYFKDKKDYRTISDMDRVLKIINDYIAKKYPDFNFLTEDKKEEGTKSFINSYEDFIEKNRENINKIFENKQFEPFLSQWIMNLTTCFEIFEESFDLFMAKKRRVIRSSHRAVEQLFDHLFDLIKATFLVLFRIVEQINMISMSENFNLESEIDYLLNDIVYLENIQRQINNAFI